ncbi:MAG: hypothetical protein ACFFDP_06510 [Promethearchaeota archaeon]
MAATCIEFFYFKSGTIQAKDHAAFAAIPFSYVNVARRTEITALVVAGRLGHTFFVGVIVDIVFLFFEN